MIVTAEIITIKKTMKKYILEMNERQAQLLSWVCDTFPRLMAGQASPFQDLFESAWEKRCKKATGKMMDRDFEGGWYKMREDAEAFCEEIKKRFWDLAPNSHYGIHYDEVSDIIWDFHRVIRHELWKNNPKHSMWTVDAENPSSSTGNEPLIKVTSKDE